MNEQIRNNEPQIHNFDSPVVHVTGPENHDERDGILPEEICSTDEEC